MGDFSFKELYDVNFRLTYPLELFGTQYEEDEIILRFDRINIALLSDYKVRTAAQGGYLNKTQVYWDETRNISLVFNNGVVNSEMLSILTNHNLLEEEKVDVPITEEINIIGIEKFKLKFPINLDKSYFLYRDKIKLSKEDYYFEDDNLIIKDKNYSNLILDYYTLKTEQKILRIGQNLLGGFLKMEGKTRLKDDIDGQEKTGIIKIPKLRIMSDLSIRLGDRETPNLFNFNVMGEPVKGRYGSYVCDIQLLDTDIDADIV